MAVSKDKMNRKLTFKLYQDDVQKCARKAITYFWKTPRMNTRIGRDVSIDQIEAEYDAVL